MEIRISIWILTNPPKLTDLAKRYGHPKGPEHKAIAFTGKSGLTPIDPMFPAPIWSSQMSSRNINDCAFTTLLSKSWLIWNHLLHNKMGTRDVERRLAEFPCKKLADKLSIHPFYARDKWDIKSRKSHPRFALPWGRRGFFKVCTSPFGFRIILYARRGMKKFGRSLSLLSGLQARSCLTPTHLLPLYFVCSSDNFHIGSTHFSLENMISLKRKFQVCSWISLIFCFHALNFDIRQLPPTFFLCHVHNASQYRTL